MPQEVAYKDMNREQLEAELDDADEREVKRSVLREFYDKKLRG